MLQQRGGFKSGRKSPYWPLEKWLRGNFWRVQTGWGAAGGGQRRPARLPLKVPTTVQLHADPVLCGPTELCTSSLP